MRKAVITLAVAGIAVGVMSEILVGSISEASEAIGLSEFFVGADRRRDRRQRGRALGGDLLRAKDKMDLAVNIAIGSSAQIALFAAPVLVLLSFFVGPTRWRSCSTGSSWPRCSWRSSSPTTSRNEGESTWFEGVQLLAVYAVLGVVFFYA